MAGPNLKAQTQKYKSLDSLNIPVWIEGVKKLHPEIMWNIALSGNEAAKVALAGRSDISEKAALKLAESNEKECLRRLSWNAHITLKVAKKLLESNSSVVKVALAENRGLAEELFGVLDGALEHHLYMALAANPSVGKETVRKLLEKGDAAVATVLLRREDMEEFVAGYIINKKDMDLWCVLSQDEKWAQAYQDELVEGPEEVCRNLSQVRVLEDRTLERLFERGFYTPSSMAAKRNLKKEQIAILLDQFPESTAATLAANPAISEELLEEMTSGAWGEESRWGSMRNPKLPVEVMEQIIESRDLDLMVALSLCPTLPQDIMERMSFEVVNRGFTIPLFMNPSLEPTSKMALPFLIHILGEKVREFFKLDVKDDIWNSLSCIWEGSLEDLCSAGQLLGQE